MGTVWVQRARIAGRSPEHRVTARSHILDNEDYDVFSDGTVRLISAPGHSPGHRVLLVRLAKRGTSVLGGDL
jgi:glyoxylase-like metal-dependent hydrolase (beta-lactamase superfamily II)